MSRAAYMDAGAMGPYLQQQEQPTSRRDYLSGIGDYAGRLYKTGENWFVKQPYKGWGGLFGLAAGLGTLLTGGLLLPALFASAVAGTTASAIAGGYYWGWGRGTRIPKNKEWLKGRSIGKYIMDAAGTP